MGVVAAASATTISILDVLLVLEEQMNRADDFQPGSGGESGKGVESSSLSDMRRGCS
jgi:hypothetical protein